MIEKVYLASLDYLKFTFGVMLAAAAIFVLVSFGSREPQNLLYVLGTLLALKVAETFLVPPSSRLLLRSESLQTASLIMRLLMNAISLFVTVGTMIKILAAVQEFKHSSHKRN